MTLAEAATRGRVVFVSSHGGPNPLANMKLAPWGRDEWIEYLLAGDRDRCASVMARLARQEAEQALLEGIPELWQIVLDRMAADEAIRGPRQALRNELDRRFADRESRRCIEGDCLAALVIRGQSSSRHFECLRRHRPDAALFRLIRHRAIQLLLAADRIADDLSQGTDCQSLANPLPRELVREAALRIAERPEAVGRLWLLIADGTQETRHPMIASLLHALGVGWKPDRPPPSLIGAYLEDASWAALELAGADMRKIDLRRANLWGVRFDRGRLEDARLARADLRTASLRAGNLDRADLCRARLARVRAEGAHFVSACLNAADLEAALLNGAILRGADLTDARLAGASLVGADLSRAKLDGADFTRADFGSSHAGAEAVRRSVRGCPLHAPTSRGATWRAWNCPASFAEADLSHALLTGSLMPGRELPRRPPACGRPWRRSIGNGPTFGAPTCARRPSTSAHPGADWSAAPSLVRGAAPASIPTTTTSRTSRAPRKSGRQTFSVPISGER
ncbi:MAG: pentapeptide repeat-containing protein [Singulisphaera sp.]